MTLNFLSHTFMIQRWSIVIQRRRFHLMLKTRLWPSFPPNSPTYVLQILYTYFGHTMKGQPTESYKNMWWRTMFCKKKNSTLKELKKKVSWYAFCLTRIKYVVITFIYIWSFLCIPQMVEDYLPTWFPHFHSQNMQPQNVESERMRGDTVVCTEM